MGVINGSFIGIMDKTWSLLYYNRVYMGAGYFVYGT